MSKSKNVKLGEKALSFHDPKTRVKVLKGQVVALVEHQLASPKIKDALKGGHLEFTDEEPTKSETPVEPKEKAPAAPAARFKSKKEAVDYIIDKYDDDIEEDEKDLMKLNFQQLIEKADQLDKEFGDGEEDEE